MHDKNGIDGEQGGLTAKQERFVQEYLIDLNATAAYKRAGYKPKSDEAAGAAAARLLGNVRVSKAVADLRKKLAEKMLMTAEEAWHEVACIAKADIGDIFDFTGESVKLRPANEIPASVRRAIQSVKVRRYIEGKGEDAREVELIEFRLWSKPEMLVARLKALGELNKPVSDILGTHIQVHTMQVCTTPALNQLPDQSDQTNERNGRILGS